MIVPMKHVTLLCVAESREATLEMLQELGLVQLNLEATDSARFLEVQSQLTAVRRARQILTDALDNKPVAPVLVAPHRVPGHVRHVRNLLSQKLPSISGAAEERVAAVLGLADLRQELVNESRRLKNELERYRPFGSFDIEQAARLAHASVSITLFRAPLIHHLCRPQNALVQILATDEKHVYGVMIGNGRLMEPFEILDLPDADVSELQECFDLARDRILKITDMLKRASGCMDLLDAHVLRMTDLSEFAAAADTMTKNGAVLWITGWMPADFESVLRGTAYEQAWGVMLRDPTPDEQVPTLLRPPRLFRPMLTLFEALGISPAYNESDISVPFFCFFSIFFAMLVADGGYGALILLLTLHFRRRMPHAPRAPFVLLSVFSVATIIWGFLSNTWFGTHPKAADNPVSLWLNDPQSGISNTMLVCFTLGVIHLSTARLWNAISLFPDVRCLAQIGWLGIIWFMYCMACSVVGIFHTPTLMYYVFGVALFLVFTFTLKKNELRDRGIELGMMPLNIISCLGDIISYVRLFAVGLASAKVAENFNSMAIDLDLPLLVKIVPVALILLIGHGLNFAMAGLSILVHAVRLNTLEFSNHKGVSWAGFAFRPFKRRTRTA